MTSSKGFPRRTAMAFMTGALFGAHSLASAEHAFQVETPEGDPIRNFAISPALAPANLPGVMVAGTAKNAPVLYEFFDYACPYCRIAFQELDVILGPDSDFRLGLVHHPVLGANSEKVAQIVIAARSLFGDAAAHRLHSLILDKPGRISVESTLALAQSLSLDRGRLEAQAMRPETRVVLEAHSRRAKEIGLKSTPSFVLGSYAFAGWPGPETVQSFVRNTRRCGGLACSDKSG